MEPPDWVITVSLKVTKSTHGKETPTEIKKIIDRDFY